MTTILQAAEVLASAHSHRARAQQLLAQAVGAYNDAQQIYKEACEAVEAAVADLTAAVTTPEPETVRVVKRAVVTGEELHDLDDLDGH